LINTECKGGEE